jgi:hypothetical protein
MRVFYHKLVSLVNWLILFAEYSKTRLTHELKRPIAVLKL